MKIDLTSLGDEPKAREPSGKPKRKTKRPGRPKKRAVTGGICAALAGILVIGGIAAYQTDAGILENKFLIGEVQIEAYEPHFPTKDTEEGRVEGVPDECELVIPFREIAKDPYIKNTGKNDCIVFFRVTNPAEVLNLVNDDGTRVKDVEEDIFFLKTADASEDEHENSFHDGWIRLDSLDGELVDKEGVNDEGRGREYIFGWHVRLKPGETTATLFDKIQNKKYGSRTIRADEIENIRVESFAIQADFIKRSGIDVPTAGELSKEDLEYIYKAFVNQNEDTVGRGGWK